MRAATALVLFLFLISSAPPTLGQGRTGPKLVVIFVVDQMRADYVDRFEREWTGGLKRLASGGAWFRNAAYPYLTTVTCAGHATIATGSFPRSHGVFQNAWWDRERGAQFTCSEDARARDIGYNTPVEHGDSAWKLQRPTLTDALRSQRGARIVSLALKDRSAIMLAGHNADAVTWLSDSLDGWVTSSVYGGGPVAAVQKFVDANPIAADFGKTWNRLLPPARYTETDDGLGEAPPRGWTRTFPHVLNGTTGARDAAYFTQWERSPFADAYVARFATALAEAFALGRRTDGSVDVLAVSFSTPDLVGHAFGPRSQEVHDVLAHLDQAIGTLLDRLDATVGKGQWIAALSADHGVTPIPEQLVAEGRDAGRISSAIVASVAQDRLRATLGEGRHVAQATGNDIYFAPGVYDKMRANPSLMSGVIQAISGVPGIARVFRDEELRDPAAAKDPIQRAAALSYFPGRSGDLVFSAKPGWILAATGTTHSSASSDDQRVPIIFYGPGVKPGRYQDAATPADIAPTMAALAGVKMPDTDGHALTVALEHP